MLIDRPNIVEGSSIQNATVASGEMAPIVPGVGELFYFTTAAATGKTGLHAFSGTVWNYVPTGSEFDLHLNDADKHLTANQNTFADALDFGAETPAAKAASVNALSAHLVDDTRHLTSAQNTLLDELVVTSTELNFMGGVTSSVQTQLNTISSSSGTTASNLATHVADDTVHLTPSQNTLIDGITVTSTVINSIPTLTSNLSTHIADDTVHLTAAQNTFLDGISLPAVAPADVNSLDGLSDFLAGPLLPTYLQSLQDNKLNRSGSQSMLGTLSMGGFAITNLLAPVNATDAATKDYVDSIQQGLSWKDSVKAATTANISLSGAQTIDGVSVVAANRVLVKNQSNPAENGVYVVAAGAWSRSADANTAVELDGMAVFVQQGATHADSAWVQINSFVTFPGDPVSFSQFAAAGGATAGSGILISGSTISVRHGNGLTFSGQDLVLSVSSEFALGPTLDLTTIGTPGTYRSVTVNNHGRITSGTNPTTLAGYGISDAVPIAGNVTMTGNLAWSGGTVILANAPGASNAWFSTAAYGTAQGDNQTHFGYNSGGTFGNYLRGAFTVIDGTLAVGGALTQGGATVWTQANLTNLSQLTNGPGYLTSATVGSFAPSLTGAGASGTWNINVTGSVGSAGSVPWSGVTGKPVQGDWNSIGSIANVVGLLGWKNYGNGHVIFDASQSTSPDGTAISNSVPINAWSGTYPTLMGWNGVQTFGVKVNRADVADNSTLLAGIAPSVGVAGSTIVQRDGSGYLYANYLNSTDNANASGVTAVMVKAGDNFIRSGTAGAIAAFVSGQSINTTGNAASATLAAKASTLAQNGGNGAAMTFNWSGQGGQPTWLWGSNDGSNHYVYNPSNFSVNYANSAGNSATTSQTSFTTMAVTSSNNTALVGPAGGLQPTSSPGSTGATISFHRPGFFGLNMGLDSDNVFRIGGWSAAANRLQLDMNGSLTVASHMNPGGNVYTDDNYGYGLVGVYDSTRYQGVFAMGDAYKLSADGTTPGSLYGIAWTHVNVGGQSKPGLSHQALFMTNGITQTAIGSGIWTLGTITTTGLLSASTISASNSISSSGEIYTASSLRIQNAAPTITLQDTDAMPAFIRNNGNQLYVRRSATPNATTWDSGPNGRHPMTMNLSNGDVTFSGNVVAYSDRRLKKDIEPIVGALEKVRKLNGVSFKRIDTNDFDIGVIAQDVQKILPEVVKEDKDGYLSVAYGNMVALLIEAIKELKAEVETLKAKG